MPRYRNPPVLPPPEELRATAVHFLRQGDEVEEADLLSACVLEVSEPRPVDQDGYVVSIALRGERKVIERLQALGQQEHPPSQLMKHIKSALTVALPCGFGLGRLEARAAGPGVIPVSGGVSLAQTAVKGEVPLPQTGSPPVPPRNTFRRLGKLWGVTLGGGPEFQIADTLGAQYLDYLLHRPGAPISALDLEMAIRPERKKVRARNSIQAQSDPQAVKSYLKELDRLRADREVAEETGDAAKANLLDQEIEALEAVVEGRACVADVGERARNNVRHAIRAVKLKLRAGSRAEKAFADHIERFISLGHQCLYNQPFAEAWD